MTREEKKRLLAVIRAAEYLFLENIALKLMLEHRAVPNWQKLLDRLMVDKEILAGVHLKFRDLYDKLEGVTGLSDSLEALLGDLPVPKFVDVLAPDETVSDGSTLAPVTDTKATTSLSKLEHEVIALLAEGLSNHEIAVRLKLSEHTVKNYLLRIFEKLGVSNRVEAVLSALRTSKPSEARGVHAAWSGPRGRNYKN